MATMLSYILIDPHPEQSPCSCTLARPSFKDITCAPVLAQERSVSGFSEEVGPS